jgi:glycosyltransferase involved in cell wall biosynthesis
MSRPPHVMHIVESLDRNAVETWLLRMLSHARRTSKCVNWTFYCQLQHPGIHEFQAEELGATVIRSPVPLNSKFAFAQNLRKELIERKVDIMHAHHDILNGYYFAASAGMNIKRFCHIHNADEHIPSRMGELAKQGIRTSLRMICLQMADRIVGISNHTLDKFIDGPRRKGRDCVHYYGVDRAKFAVNDKVRLTFREEIGVKPEARLLLFGGRIVPEKNPLFALQVFSEMRKVDPELIFVVAGAGGLETAMKLEADALDVASAVKYLGWRSDLAQIMRSSDIFILPRPEYPPEGFGLAVLEAQLAGLRILVSEGVLNDPILSSASVNRISLKLPAAEWARIGIGLLRQPLPPITTIIEEFDASPFQMDYALNDLLQLYA